MIVALESTSLCPWAPFYLIYAALAIAVPLYFRNFSFKGDLRRGLRIFALIFILMEVYNFVYSISYTQLLVDLNLQENPFFSLDAALNELLVWTSHRLSIPLGSALAVYAIYVIIWAPIGEELFYRGYLYSALRRRGYLTAALVSSLLFGVRHMTHFVGLPSYPLVAGLSWAIFAFGFGLIECYLYERTESLLLCMILHLTTNLLSMILGI